MQPHIKHKLLYYMHQLSMLIASSTAPHMCLRMYKCKPQPDTTLASSPPSLSLSLSPSPTSAEQYSTLKNASCHQVQSSLLYSTPEGLPASQGKSHSADDHCCGRTRQKPSANALITALKSEERTAQHQTSPLT